MRGENCTGINDETFSSVEEKQLRELPENTNILQRLKSDQTTHNTEGEEDRRRIGQIEERRGRGER